MTYVAQKPCRLAGQAFLIGDVIPDEVIHPGAAKNLLRMGIISTIGEETPPAVTKVEKDPISVYVHTEEGELDCHPTQESLQQVFDVLQGNVTTAETTINVMTDPDALILIDVCDSRKSVKAAVKERGLLLAEDHATTEEVGEN